VRHLVEPILEPPQAYGMTTLTESEPSEPRTTAADPNRDRDRPQGRAMLRSLCLHASILGALAVARIALPPLDALEPKRIEVTLAEALKKPLAPGTAEDPDSGSAAGARGGAAKAASAEPEPAPAPAAAAPEKPAQPVAPPQVVETPKSVTPPPRPRRPKPVVAQAERPPKPATAPIVQPKLMPQPLTAPVAPEATAPAPHALVAPTPLVPAAPPPPEVSRLQPPPPSLAEAAPSSSSFSSSQAGGSSAAGSGTGLSGSGPGAAAAGAGSGAGTGYGGPGRGSGRGDEYLARLRRHIMNYHRYPDGARGIGVATVSFAVAADGTISHVALEHSSGDAIIDRDAVNLLHRASPVPPPPPERLQAGHVELAIPVEYEPGFFERLFR